MTSIDSFPNDNIERVVYLYSSLKLNTSSNSDNILVEVLLIEINPENPDQLKINDRSHGKYSVTFRDIDTVQLGSIWRGQNLLEGKTYNFEKQLTKAKFEFDLSIRKPKIIQFQEDFSLNEKIFLPRESPYSIYPLKKYIPFSMSKYCILKTEEDIEILVNCIQVLHAFYLPARKKIRGDLINDNLSIATIVNEYFESYRIITIDNKDTFEVFIKEKQSKKIAKEVIIFLANLALNSTTQQKIFNIRKSLNDVKLDKFGKPYPSRFPSVIPPHSTTLKFEAEGIWLEYNKKFLVTHVIDTSAIVDYPIIAYQVEVKSEAIEEPEQKNNLNKKKNGEKRISTTSNPNRSRGEVKQQTDIVVNSEECNFNIVSIQKYSDIPRIQHINKKKNIKESSEISSGDAMNKKNNNVKKFENKEKQIKRSQVNDFEIITKALIHISQEKDSNLHSVNFVMASGQTSNNYSLIQISSLVQNPLHLSWIDGIYGRKLLFLELNFTNNKVAYLIDIDKNKEGESFCAFLIVTNQKIGHQEIKRICTAIEKTKGIKKWLKDCKSMIVYGKSLNHIYTTKSEWIQRFKILFKDILQI